MQSDTPDYYGTNGQPILAPHRDGDKPATTAPEHKWHRSIVEGIDAEIDLPGGWMGDLSDGAHGMRLDKVKAYIVDDDLVVAIYTDDGWVHEPIPAEVIGACLSAMTAEDATDFRAAMNSVARVEECAS